MIVRSIVRMWRSNASVVVLYSFKHFQLIGHRHLPVSIANGSLPNTRMYDKGLSLVSTGKKYLVGSSLKSRVKSTNSSPTLFTEWSSYVEIRPQGQEVMLKPRTDVMFSPQNISALLWHILLRPIGTIVRSFIFSARWINLGFTLSVENVASQ